MFKKYGSDPTRNLLVDHVESTAKAYNGAVYNLKAYDDNKIDIEEETSNAYEGNIRRTKRI